MAGIIQSYGLFWSASDVFWGRGKQKGTLLGVPSKARASRPVDFRDQIGVYVLYSGHRMVYVGQTGSGGQRLFKRLKAHKGGYLAGRWDRFSWFGLRKVLANGALSGAARNTGASLGVALNHIEAVLIAAAEPALNKQGGRFGKQARKYIQVRDVRLGLTRDDMIRELWRLRNEE